MQPIITTTTQAQCNAIGKRYSVGEFCSFPVIDAIRNRTAQHNDDVQDARDILEIIDDDYQTGTLMPVVDDFAFADNNTTL